MIFCPLFWFKIGLLSLRCSTKVFISKFYFIAELENEEKLITWSSKSTKLLISLRLEKTDLFDKSKVWKKVARDKVAEQLNAKSLVRVAGEQCSNKWKKNRREVQKLREHNATTGNLKTQWWPVNYSTGDCFLFGYSIHWSKSSVAEVIDFLTEFKEEKRKEE